MRASKVRSSQDGFNQPCRSAGGDAASGAGAGALECEVRIMGKGEVMISRLTTRCFTTLEYLQQGVGVHQLIGVETKFGW